MAPKSEENISEIVNILNLINCPLLIRTDDWWVEELLFKPGKPRTDLICWIVSNINSVSFSPDLDSTNVSTISTVSSVSSNNNLKLLESDEGIVDFLSNIGVCKVGECLPFVKGLLPKEEQIKLWQLLIKPCLYLQKSTINTHISFGSSSLNNIVSMENFLDAFSVGASLLPADLKSEIEKTLGEKTMQKDSRTYTFLERNTLQDKLLVQNCSELANKIEVAANLFIHNSQSDLKIYHPKKDTFGNLIEIGDEIDTITTKIAAWKRGMDSLLETQQLSITSEVNRKRIENLLVRSTKDQSFKPFQNLYKQSD